MFIPVPDIVFVKTHCWDESINVIYSGNLDFHNTDPLAVTLCQDTDPLAVTLFQYTDPLAVTLFHNTDPLAVTLFK